MGKLFFRTFRKLCLRGRKLVGVRRHEEATFRYNDHLCPTNHEGSMRLEQPWILNQKVLDYQQPDEVVDTIRSPLQRAPRRSRVIMYDWLYNTEHSH